MKLSSRLRGHRDKCDRNRRHFHNRRRPSRATRQEPLIWKRGLGAALAVDGRLILRFDWTIFWSVLALAAIGVLSVMSASYGGPHKGIDPLVVRQAIWVAVGTVVMLAAVFLDYRTFETYAYAFYVLA